MFTINRQITSTTKVSANLKIAAAAAPAQTLRTSAPITATPITGELNPPQGFTGPSPNLPEANTPGYVPTTGNDRQASLNEALEMVSQTDALRALIGPGSSTDIGADTAADIALLTAPINNGRPAFDQDYSTPSVGENPVSSGNPMNGFLGGSIGGLLGAAAQSDVKTLADFNSRGLFAADPKTSFPGPTSGAPAETDGNGEVSVRIPTKPVEEESFFSKLAKLFTGQITLSGEPTERQKALDATRADTPAEENTPVFIVTQTLLDQKRAAKAGKPTSQGGSGDATPVDDGGLGGVVRDGSIAVNQSSINGRNLFGQPGGAGGENVSGGNKGLNGFTNPNGAGVIDPGPDGGSPQGDARFAEDPGQATGGRQTSPNLNGGRDSGQQSDSTTSNTSTTLAAGARNLTLTGTAAINGTGNALDNLINGNEAANQLRGGAGDDTLNGRGGNDLLDGGRGRDVLTGGTGADRFRFSSSGSFGSNKADRITDFSSSEGDRIEISRSAFGIDAGAQVSFQTVSSRVELIRALESSTLLIQDTRDGSLLFNQNGAAAGAGQGGIFALVSNGASLQASNFTLLA